MRWGGGSRLEVSCRVLRVEESSESQKTYETLQDLVVQRVERVAPFEHHSEDIANSVDVCASGLLEQNSGLSKVVALKEMSDLRFHTPLRELAHRDLAVGDNEQPRVFFILRHDPVTVYKDLLLEVF